MLEVATISTQVTDDMTGFMNQVMSRTQEIPIKAPEAAKALYSIVSAGHDGADGMKILEVSAKAAVGRAYRNRDGSRCCYNDPECL